jgi:hypothetical protein
MTLHLPLVRGWTTARDAALRVAYREHPGAWTHIGRAINRHPNTVRDRAVVLGLHAGRDRLSGHARATAKIVNSEPLPAGHPVSWGAVTAGTMLEGEGFGG